MADKLAEQNKALAQKIEETREKGAMRRAAHGYVEREQYLLSMIAASLDLESAKLEFIDRAQFGADVAITVPALLKKGSKEYINEHLPKLLERVQKSVPVKEGWIVKAEQKGLYLNLLLSDEYLFDVAIKSISELKERYGETDGKKEKTVVLDYSHPNVAKHLHAGHIRSTIIGHILRNIYEAVGYTAFGMNHINDWGGFGFLMEAYARWGNEESGYENKNDFLYSLYVRYRQMEKEAEQYDGGPFVEFKEKADARFRDLEAGKPEAVELWQKMVTWSLEDFQRFYDLIDIHLDVIAGESFYARRGGEIVEEALKAKTAVIEDGAAVVHVGDEVDFVIRRSDESTIYATRDLAALEYRSQKLGAERMVYVVGQEQTDYFARLFKATDMLGIVKTGTVLEHVPFGFYVSSHTKKKLSSREGAQNVISLIESAIAYFHTKYPELSDSDIKKIAVGSITFNDIKKSRMGAVELDTGNVQKIMQSFEESGAGYVMYAATRARSIVRKYGKPVPERGDVRTKNMKLAPAEVLLLKRLAELPIAIVRASETNEPSVLAEYLVRTAQDYNSYYESFPVLAKDGTLLHPARLVITNAVVQVLINGLRLCHVEVPEKM